MDFAQYLANRKEEFERELRRSLVRELSPVAAKLLEAMNYSLSAGFAYRLNDTTVIRAGAGLFYVPSDTAFWESAIGQAFNIFRNNALATVDNSVTYEQTMSNPFPNGLIQAPGRDPKYSEYIRGGNPRAPFRDAEWGYTTQWNFALQKDLGGFALEAAYAGSRGVHLATGGQDFNVIPEQVTVKGTIRAFDETVRAGLRDRLVELAQGLAAVAGAVVEFELFEDLTPMVNDPAVTAVAREAAVDVVGAERMIQPPPQMVSEDFALVLDRVPGTMVLLGAGNPDVGASFPHHHPRFDIDERSFAVGAEIALGFVERFLG